MGSYTAAGTPHGFLLSGGEFTTIDVPGALFTSYASGINDVGRVVGRFDTSSTNFGFLLSGAAYAAASDWSWPTSLFSSAPPANSAPSENPDGASCSNSSCCH